MDEQEQQPVATEAATASSTAAAAAAAATTTTVPAAGWARGDEDAGVHSAAGDDFMTLMHAKSMRYMELQDYCIRVIPSHSNRGETILRVMVGPFYGRNSTIFRDGAVFTVTGSLMTSYVTVRADVARQRADHDMEWIIAIEGDDMPLRKRITYGATYEIHGKKCFVASDSAPDSVEEVKFEPTDGDGWPFGIRRRCDPKDHATTNDHGEDAQEPSTRKRKVESTDPPCTGCTETTETHDAE